MVNKIEIWKQNPETVLIKIKGKKLLMELIDHYVFDDTQIILNKSPSGKNEYLIELSWEDWSRYEFSNTFSSMMARLSDFNPVYQGF